MTVEYVSMMIFVTIVSIIAVIGMVVFFINVVAAVVGAVLCFFGQHNWRRITLIRYCTRCQKRQVRTHDLSTGGFYWEDAEKK